MFDEKTIAELKYYVYLLVNPETNTPFYVGKGEGNRVFDHLNEAKEGKKGTDKLDQIQAILKQNKTIEHVIVRHGLNEKTAYQIEASLIDTFRFFPAFNAFAGVISKSATVGRRPDANCRGLGRQDGQKEVTQSPLSRH